MMRRLGIAFRSFFRALKDQRFADELARLLDGVALAPQPAVATVERPRPERKRLARSDALNLLAALQREGRLVDFLQEPITAYSDAQIGAAVRDVHRDCGAVLTRMFALQPLEAREEGAEFNVPAGFDPARLRLVGNVEGAAPYRGKLAHAGWRATRCELPEWTGADDAALVVAPAEVEVR